MSKLLRVLRSKAGFSTELGLSMLSVLVMFGLAATVVAYGLSSVSSTQHKVLAAAIESRASAFAGDLNVSLTDDAAAPARTHKWDVRAGTGTTINSVTDNADGTKTLVIKAQNENASFSLVRSVVIEPTSVTHITGFDEADNPKWATSNEPSAFTMWGPKKGSVRPLTAAEEAGQSRGTTWKTLTANAGIDSSGQLWTWWNTNNTGQAGDGTISNTKRLVKVMPGTKFRSVVTGTNTNYAIDERGSLWVWGSNLNSQLGLPSTVTNQATPVRVPGLDQPIVQVATGTQRVYAIDTRGRLWGWGSNNVKTLGTEDTATIVQTPSLATSNRTFQYVSTNATATFAIDTTGAMWFVGNDASGHVRGTTTPTSTTAWLALVPGTKFVAADYYSGIFTAIDSEGSLWSSGRGSTRPIGDGTLNDQLGLKKIPTTTKFTSVSVWDNQTYVISTSGELYGWGKSTSNRLNSTDTTDVLVPKPILPGVVVSSVAANFAGTTAVTVLDNRGAMWVIGTRSATLWPTSFTSGDSLAFKHPFPADFDPNGWN
ncbi:RCC1 domain-containing protein [Frigoribacterium sp. SL97]|uniref:RCC1 domain-containing protein n=1 Tax=Frigoribacterium sp. SL97 TaxID=2994664 RepID=UPI00226E9615|nr:hypothetical protein [Frigoribacterium sp. SL97]WAC50568.1 hypothetical protein OVA02_11860 [Frigoribacterium sp. SL97]